jgi:hypothetical protein
LRRRAPEPIDRGLESFYHHLLAAMQRPEVRDGQWELLRPLPAWDGNPTWRQFIAYRWQGPEGRLLVAVNYAGQRGQCYVPLADSAILRQPTIRLHDLLHARATYERTGTDLVHRGLYLDVPPWRAHVFEILEG